ncbi:MAG TPA: pilin [Candidatus Paceibacterota bacterium]
MIHFLKVASAAGLVPCEGTECTKGDLLQLGANIFNFLIDAAFILAVLFIMIGGAMMLVSGGSPNLLARGKKTITTAVVGLVIVLVAWVLVNTLITSFTDCTGQWWQFDSLTCG